MIAHARHRSVMVAALAGAAVACKKAPPPPPPAAPPVVAFSVTGVTLGKAVGADRSVAQPLTTFGPKDTIYASVATVGSTSSATMAALWTFQTGQTVFADTQALAPQGPAHTEFHISKPSGWPVGKYKVAISLDGAPAGAQDFEVKR
ncbi:MAG TPA: hypothetical protein VKB63_09295 [Gemmatimonadales bacterium]|nr:hypothetical protein [Gemmatimonadales bacterium]